VIEEFPSQLKAAKYLEVSRYKISQYLNSGNLLNSKLGPVFLINKGQSKERSIKIQVLDINKNILDTCSSLRAAEKKILSYSYFY